MQNTCKTLKIPWQCLIAGAAGAVPSTSARMELRVRPVNEGLQGALALWAGFAPLSAEERRPGARARSARFGVALWSGVPAELPGASVEVRTCFSNGEHRTENRSARGCVGEGALAACAASFCLLG